MFDASGNAYVTDSFQATVWLVPPGGGTAQPWFQNAAIDGAVFGPNGIRFSPDGTELCVAVTGPPGSIRCITFPQPSKHRVLRSYPTEGPDNMAFGEWGKLYVALATANQVGVLAYPTGNELRRFSGPAQGTHGPVPWDAPAGVAFINADRSLLVVNHALLTGLVNPKLFVVFDVFVNDTAHPLHLPSLSWAGS